MAFSLPFIEYTNLLHAHSHFAFNGWISFMLQLLILNEFTDDYKTRKTFWKGFFLVSTIINYMMIVSFAATGYGPISIAISTIGLFLSYIFCYKIYRAIPIAISNNISTAFAKVAMFWLGLSSIGPYALGISMATKASGNMQHNALYFFLYFQYAGWFTFAILSFLFKKLESVDSFNKKTASTIFNLFLFSCIPGYLFVCSFQTRSAIVTIILTITAIVQTVGLVALAKLMFANKADFSRGALTAPTVLYVIAILSFALKFILQFLSIHPALEQISLTNRPVMIAYLHMVFLCFVSIYLVAMLVEKRIIAVNTYAGLIGMVSFVAGVIINEVFLVFQGIAALIGFYPHSLPMLLFYNTIIMAGGALLVFITSVTPWRLINYSLHINNKPSKIISWKL